MSHAHGSQDNFEEAVDSEDDYVVDCEEMIMMKWFSNWKEGWI